MSSDFATNVQWLFENAGPELVAFILVLGIGVIVIALSKGEGGDHE